MTLFKKLIAINMAILLLIQPVDILCDTTCHSEDITTYIGSEPIAIQCISSTTIEVEPEVETINYSEQSIEPTVIEDISNTISDEEIDLLALVTMGEAEDQCEEGKRLVIDTILNRVDHETRWPDTISEVIYQKNQFTCMWNGRIKRCTVTDYVRQLVREEIQCRYNSEVVFFRMSRYSSYGTPMFKVQDHYFSGC